MFQMNPYTGEPMHPGMGAYAHFDQHIVGTAGMGGLGASECNLSKFIEDNMGWVIGVSIVVLVLKAGSKHNWI